MCGWGLTDIFAKKAIDKIGYAAIPIYTGLPALIISGFIIILRSPDFNFTALHLLLMGLVALLDLTAYLLIYKAYTIGKVSIINPISSAYTIPALVFSVLLFGETIVFLEGVSVFLIIAGVILTSLNFKKLTNGLKKKDFAKGVPLGVLAALIWGMVIPLFNLTLENNTWYVGGFVLILMEVVFAVIYNLFIKKQDILFSDKKVLRSLFWAGLTYGGGYLALAWGLTLTDFTSITTAISAAYPLVLVPAAALILKEKNALNQYLGVILITGGIIIFSLA